MAAKLDRLTPSGQIADKSGAATSWFANLWQRTMTAIEQRFTDIQALITGATPFETLNVNGATVTTLGNAATRNVGTVAGTVAAGDDSRITGAAQKSSNLSDLGSASTARTNLGLGTAATASTGTSGHSLPFLDGNNTHAGALDVSGLLKGKGTATNDNAAAGYIGEYISSSGSGVSLSSATTTNIASISLTAGDWEVSGTVAFLPSGITSYSLEKGWISQTSATDPGAPNGGGYWADNPPAGTGGGFNVGSGLLKRISLPSTTTIYLSASATYVGGSMTADGFIAARRPR